MRYLPITAASQQIIIFNMPLEALPYSDTPLTTRPKSSPLSKVAFHLGNQLRRPTRLRRRAIISGLALFAIVSLILGRRHAVSFGPSAAGAN